VDAAFDATVKLAKMKTVKDAPEIHTEFLQAQTQRVFEQTHDAVLFRRVVFEGFGGTQPSFQNLKDIRYRIASGFSCRVHSPLVTLGKRVENGRLNKRLKARSGLACDY
jgi:hypothetical protein